MVELRRHEIKSYSFDLKISDLLFAYTIADYQVLHSDRGYDDTNYYLSNELTLSYYDSNTKSIILFNYIYNSASVRSDRATGMAVLSVQLEKFIESGCPSVRSQFFK